MYLSRDRIWCYLRRESGFVQVIAFAAHCLLVPTNTEQNGITEKKKKHYLRRDGGKKRKKSKQTSITAHHSPPNGGGQPDLVLLLLLRRRGSGLRDIHNNICGGQFWWRDLQERAYWRPCAGGLPEFLSPTITQS